MPRPVEIKSSHTPVQLRSLAVSTKDANRSRRLLSIAAILDGTSRAEAARIGGMVTWGAECAGQKNTLNAAVHSQRDMSHRMGCAASS